MSYIRNGKVVLTVFDRLADEIRRAHAAVEEHTRQSHRRAREAGTLLYKAKDQMKHGRFMEWVKKEFEFSHATANLYMRIYKAWDLIEANSQRVENLGLNALDRWLTDQVAQQPTSTGTTLRGRTPAFMNQYRAVLLGIRNFLQPSGRTYDSLANLLPHLTRFEQEYVRVGLVQLGARVDAAVARVDQYISGEIDRMEQAENERRTRLLEQWEAEEGSPGAFTVDDPSTDKPQAVPSEMATVG